MKVSLSLATIASLLLLSVGDLVVAQVSAPLCTEASSFLWVCLYHTYSSSGLVGLRSIQSYNSLDQNPCTVGAYLLSTCYNGSKLFQNLCTVCTAHVSLPAAFNVPPLGDYVAYAGPSERKVSEAGPCWCNTVLYNLLSACSECQGGMSISYVFSAINGTAFSAY